MRSYSFRTNIEILYDLAKRYNPPTPANPTPAPTKKSSYFDKLDVAVRMELDHGKSHIIDVQPDLRFPFQYSIYNTTERYPDLNVKGHPFTSTFTLIAYDQLILNAYLLICDLYSREIPSYHTFPYKSETLRSDYLAKLMECYVPPTLSRSLTP